MITGGGVLIGQMRPDVVTGRFLPTVISSISIGLEGGAWLDAPEFFAAGSTRRAEEWMGNVGRAYADATTARRS